MNNPEKVLHQQLQSTIAPSATTAARTQLSSAAPYNAYLTVGQILQVGQFITSPSGYFSAIMQSDGNFCVYRGTLPQANPSWLWGSQVTGGEGAYFAVMQGDGNFCVYAGTPSQQGPFLWGTADSSRPDGQFFLAIQDDGNLCVYQGSPQNNQGYVWGSQALDSVVDCTDITAINFDLSQATFQSVTPDRVYTTQVTNNSPATPQTSSIGGSYTVTETSGWSNALSLKVGVKTSFKTGLPVIAEGKVEISAEITDTYTWNGSSSVAQAFNFNAQVTVPPSTTLKCTVTVSMSAITLPYSLTGTLIYGSGQTAQGTLLGQYKGTTSGDTTIVYTPVNPAAPVTQVKHMRLFPSVSAGDARAAA